MLSFSLIMSSTFAAPSEPDFTPREPPRQGRPAVLIQYKLSEGSQVRSRANGVKDIRLHLPAKLVTDHFLALLRNRHLWRDVGEAMKSMGQKCRNVLAHLGMSDSDVDVLAAVGVIQVVIDAELPEHCREFPWEFTIAEATRTARHSASDLNREFCVVRHWPIVAHARTPSSVLVVESAPGRIGNEYDFESERKIVTTSLGLRVIDPLVNPDLAQLRRTLRSKSPDVVHLTGVDGIQGAKLLGNVELLPGMYFRSGDAPSVASFNDLAEVLVSGTPAPCLVSFNIYNSVLAAAAALEKGALTAIAFQDEVDDTVAEQFFYVFYTEWKRANWDIVKAFWQSWRRLGNYTPRMRGTGIIVWSRLPLLAGGSILKRAGSASTRQRKLTIPERVVVPSQISDPLDCLKVDFKKLTALNYSLLHNGDKLFTTFKINRRKAGIYRAVTVNVKLYAGPEVAQYEAAFDLDDDHQSIDVNELVTVPLTSQLSRSVMESVYTTISISVRWGDHIIAQQTDRVSLLPVDQWRDDDLNRKWLPSFILPRDPIIKQVIDRAQRYLVAISDDSGAGFDGYQSFNASGETLDEKCKYIDAQVRAIWWALVHDYAIGYINPPPSFVENEQRLRTPSEVVQGKRGTCIDLALLLAACLEYIEIYPVIFLLRDHAFPGYWRSEPGYAKLDKIAISEIADGYPREAVQGSWMFPSNSFASLTRLVQEGVLVPIETVQLTQRASFATAINEGLQNLRSRRYFHSLYDIRRARTDKSRPVTPLPMVAYLSRNGEI
jgi:hypothetical protein